MAIHPVIGQWNYFITAFQSIHAKHTHPVVHIIHDFKVVVDSAFRHNLLIN